MKLQPVILLVCFLSLSKQFLLCASAHHSVCVCVFLYSLLKFEYPFSSSFLDCPNLNVFDDHAFNFLVISRKLTIINIFLTDVLAGVKVLHGLDKVIEGGAVVLTLKDQSILANGDINEGEIIIFSSNVYFLHFLFEASLGITLGGMCQMLICSRMWKLASKNRGMRLTRLQRRNQGFMKTSKIPRSVTMC